jgi:hypothetical protein
VRGPAARAESMADHERAEAMIATAPRTVRSSGTQPGYTQINGFVDFWVLAWPDQAASSKRLGTSWSMGRLVARPGRV